MDKIDTSSIGDSKTLELANAINGIIDHLGIAPATPAPTPVDPTPAADPVPAV